MKKINRDILQLQVSTVPLLEDGELKRPGCHIPRPERDP